MERNDHRLRSAAQVIRLALLMWLPLSVDAEPIQTVTESAAGVKWVTERSEDGRFYQISFVASPGQYYTIERSPDLSTWETMGEYWGFGQTIRYAIYQYVSESGDSGGDPLVEDPDIRLVNVQVNKVSDGGVLLVWPSLQTAASSKVVSHYLPLTVLEGVWPPLMIGIYGNHHITQIFSDQLLEHIPESTVLGAEDTAFVNQFVLSLPALNIAAASSEPFTASVVATGIEEGKQFFFRVKRQYNLDTDGDGLSNEAELETFGTNWLAADSDYDGINDRYELHEAFESVFIKELSAKADLVNGKIPTSQLPVQTYLLLGQSNALGNAPVTGVDNIPRESIQIFNRETGTFENWDISNPVPGMAAKENFAFRFAQQMQKIGVNSRFIVSAVGGASIATFLPHTGGNMLQLEQDIQAAGVNRIDGVLWMQGEADGYARMTATNYKLHFESIRQHISAIAGTAKIPWIVGELAGGMNSQDSKNVVFDSYAADPLVRVMPNRSLPTYDGIHFTGDSLLKMGFMAFSALHGVARNSSDPVLYQQWAEKRVAFADLKLTKSGGASYSTNSGYLRMNVMDVGDKVKADLMTTGLALKIGTSQSSRFDRYGARVSFRIPSLFPDDATLILNLGVHPTADRSGDLTATTKGIQLRIAKNQIVLATSDGANVTTKQLATTVSAGQDIDSFVLEINESVARLYRSKENVPSTVVLECDNVPQGDYGGYSYGANFYLRADTGGANRSVYVDLVRISTRRYGL